MPEIKLTQGYSATVDEEDFQRLSKFKWQALTQPSKQVVYAKTRMRNEDGSYSTVLMHRFILGLVDKNIQVDHDDNEGLNNRKNNLIPCSGTENSQGRRNKRNSTSRFKGVFWQATNKKWRACIQTKTGRKSLGLFFSEVEAARAYDRAALEHFKAFATLNFNMEDYYAC